MTFAALSTDPTIIATLDRLVALVSANGAGITLNQIAHALARELSSSSPDPGRIGDHAHRLELDPEELQ